MYSTSELDELFQILNLIEKDLNLKGLEPHWSNTTIDEYLAKIKRVDASLVLSLITLPEVEKIINELPKKTIHGHDSIINVLLKSVQSLIRA